MSNCDTIKKSYDAFRSLKRDVEALTYLASLIPDEDEHHALVCTLAEKLDADSTSLFNELLPLWATLKPEPVKG